MIQFSKELEVHGKENSNLSLFFSYEKISSPKFHWDSCNPLVPPTLSQIIEQFHLAQEKRNSKIDKYPNVITAQKKSILTWEWDCWHLDWTELTGSSGKDTDINFNMFYRCLSREQDQYPSPLNSSSRTYNMVKPFAVWWSCTAFHSLVFSPCQGASKARQVSAWNTNICHSA